jgi:hypothetical protein
METEHSQLICNYTFYDQLELWGHYGELHKALAVILRGSACRRRPGVRVISPQPHPTLTCLYVSHIHWLIIQSRRSSSMCFTKIGTVGGPRCCKKCQGGTNFCVLWYFYNWVFDPVVYISLTAVCVQLLSLVTSKLQAYPCFRNDVSISW